jgi:hypothetical protein
LVARICGGAVESVSRPSTPLLTPLPSCPQFIADGVFYAELNELLTRELAEDGYSGVEVRVTPMRTEIIIRATRTQNVLGEWGRAGQAGGQGNWQGTAGPRSVIRPQQRQHSRAAGGSCSASRRRLVGGGGGLLGTAAGATAQASWQLQQATVAGDGSGCLACVSGRRMRISHDCSGAGAAARAHSNGCCQSLSSSSSGGSSWQCMSVGGSTFRAQWPASGCVHMAAGGASISAGVEVWSPARLPHPLSSPQGQQRVGSCAHTTLARAARPAAAVAAAAARVAQCRARMAAARCDRGCSAGSAAAQWLLARERQ